MPANFYNDEKFSYNQYWQGREYEHASELAALDKLISGQHFHHIVDLGGGYGRLVPYLLAHGDHVTLIEPSAKQRLLVKQNLSSDKRITIKAGQGSSSGLSDNTVDLVILIRVIHHLSDLTPVFTEIHRILSPSGLVIFEFANSLNIKARLRHLFLGHPISKYPVDLRSPQNQNLHTIPFLNHHPETIFKTLHLCRFLPTRILSVSNFRSPVLKKILPLPLLLSLEKFTQPLLANLYYGPSIFVLARRLSPSEASA